MRGLLTVGLLLAAALSFAERIVLIPLDSRPAAGQFAQMIARMANVEVIQPPYTTLGRFTNPGNPEAILDWLDSLDLSEVSSVICSSDMIAYGGLIASRIPDTSYALAQARIQRFVKLRQRFPQTKFYVFSSVMRLAPTATRAAASWRIPLTRYAEAKERFRLTKDSSVESEMRSQQAKVPPIEIERYEQARKRDHKLQRDLVKLSAAGVFDYLIFGQDDAKPVGPHVPETLDLKALTTKLNIGGRVYFCEGIDQHANVLLSRALLRGSGWTPHVRVVFSDELGRNRVADYESKTISQSVRDQIFASGARPTTGNDEYDYTLYLNTPNRRERQFQNFLSNLGNEVDQGFPIAVSDIDLAGDGTADPELFEGLCENGRVFKLLAYAGWNTAGNSMGTTIPAANVYLLARRLQTDPLEREIAQREFLLHRFVNDFAYHKYTRPQAYRMIDASPKASREETYGSDFIEVNDFVRRDLTKRLQETFRTQFLGKTFFAGGQQYEVDGLGGIKIFLPWPRAYEVRLEFSLSAKPAKH